MEDKKELYKITDEKVEKWHEKEPDKIVADKEAEIRKREEFREAMRQIRQIALTTPGFIDHLLESPATNDRPFVKYLKLLGITSSELGRKTLNIGSGEN